MSESVLKFPATDSEGLVDERTDRRRRLGLLEAVIFAASEPPTADQLAELAGVTSRVIREDLRNLMEACEADNRGVQIRAIGGTYQIATKPEHHEAVRAFAKSVKPRMRLSRAALETLAVVAYKQPVTLPEINAIRGVSSASGVIHTLLSHNLVAVAGRKKVVGRPICYKTTPDFLGVFGLDTLSELPTVKELGELGAASQGEQTELELLPASGDGVEADEDAETGQKS